MCTQAQLPQHARHALLLRRCCRAPFINSVPAGLRSAWGHRLPLHPLDLPTGRLHAASPPSWHAGGSLGFLQVPAQIKGHAC